LWMSCPRSNISMKLIQLLSEGLLMASILEVVGVAENTHRLRLAAVSQNDHASAVTGTPRMPKGHNPFEPLKEDSKHKVMNAINKFRAEVCYRMKKEHGVEFGGLDKCEKFMKKACRPGNDEKMDGDHHEITSGDGYCREFFPVAERKAIKQVEEEEEEEEDKATMEEGEGKVRKPVATPPKDLAPARGAAAPQEPATKEQQRVSPSPAPQAVLASPSGAPRQPDTLGDDEAYYYKDGGKSPIRLHMDEDLKLPTQGYWGKLVSHDDMETVTEDWGVEFGSHAGFGTEESYCKSYCNTKWCIRRGYCDREHNNSGVLSSVNAFVFLLVAVSAMFHFSCS